MSAEDTQAEAHWNRTGFWAFIYVQSQGAFNDNLYRWVITYWLFLRYAHPETGLLDPAKAGQVTALGAMIFSIPYIAFPGVAGALSDRYSKRTITIATKIWEVFVMVAGLLAFRLEVVPLIWAMHFLMSMQSAFFSPAKYGMLPEVLPRERLSWGNGVLNMATFVAIIAGTACAGPLFEYQLSTLVMSAILIALSLTGLACSIFVPRIAAAAPDRRIPYNPWAGLGRPARAYWGEKTLFYVLLAGIYFWFAGAVFQQNVANFAKITLGLSEFPVSAMVAAVGFGTGAGSIASGYLSRGRIELGFVPLGMAAVALSTAVLGLVPTDSFPVLLGLLVVLGAAAGFYVVPVNATIQHRAPIDLKGGMVAAQNVVNCCGILVGGGLYMAAGAFGALPPLVFAVMAGLTAVVGAGLCLTYPPFAQRAGALLALKAAIPPPGEEG